MLSCSRAARGIEYMVIDCLKAADGTLKLSEDIWDAKQYLYFNDSILEVAMSFLGLDNTTAAVPVRHRLCNGRLNGLEGPLSCVAGYPDRVGHVLNICKLTVPVHRLPLQLLVVWVSKTCQFPA